MAYEAIREASGHSEAFPGYTETLERQNVVPVVHQMYASGSRRGHIAHAYACTCFKLKWSCKHGKTCREGRSSDENVADDEPDDATALIDLDDALGQDASVVDDQDRKGVKRGSDGEAKPLIARWARFCRGPTDT